MPLSFRIVIPTRDSAGWIGVFLDAYREVGVEPLYIYDMRSADETLAVLSAKGAEVRGFTPSDDFAEAGMVEFGSRRAGAKWVLRIDDDEFPSRSLLDWVSRSAVRSAYQAWLLSRRELFRHAGKVVYSRIASRYARADRPDFLHPLARLYRPDQVRYIDRVHTVGFEEPPLIGFAPKDAFFIHCNCLLRGPTERLEKLRRYERIEPLSAWKIADEYLPEIIDFDRHRAGDDGLSEFSALLERLPMPPDVAPPDLTAAERDVISQQLQDHCAKLDAGKKLYREGDSGRRRLLADQTSLEWIRFVPKSMLKPLAETLCSFGNERMRGVGERLWNYWRYLSELKRQAE